MTAAWMLHATLAGLLLGLAARAAEDALAAYRLPVRWAWAAAALGALGLPAAAAADLPRRLASLLTASGAPVGLPVPPGAAGGLAGAPPPPPAEGLALPALPPAVDAVALAVWIGGSVLLAALGVRAWLGLRRRRSAWKRATVEGTEVLVSERVGPALIGFRDPAPVLPGWVLDLPPGERRLVVRHELEHREARDPVLLGCALAGLVAAPWNPALWWIVRRLRLAVELDCDRRVLDDGTPPGDYGALLLQITRGRRAVPLPGVALGGRSSRLERRIRVMTDTIPRFRSVRAAFLTLAAAGLLAAACDAPTPVEGPGPGPEAAASRSAADADAGGERGVGDVLGADAPDRLVYVDGVRIDDEASTVLDDLEAADVASVEVIKGPAAVGSYGEAGGNGVIRITTKEGGTLSRGAGVGDAPRVGAGGRVGDGSEIGAGARIGPPDGSGAAGSEGGIRIRGDASLDLEGARPLILLDGEPVERGSRVLEELSPDRIASIEVLKGPAAVDAHGEEGRDGVVRITTKGGDDDGSR